MLCSRYCNKWLKIWVMCSVHIQGTTLKTLCYLLHSLPAQVLEKAIDSQTWVQASPSQDSSGTQVAEGIRSPLEQDVQDLWVLMHKSDPWPIRIAVHPKNTPAHLQTCFHTVSLLCLNPASAHDSTDTPTSIASADSAIS